MSDRPPSEFENRLRTRLSDRAGGVSAPPDEVRLAAAATQARRHSKRRRWQAGTLAIVTAVLVSVGLTVTTIGGVQHQVTGQAGPEGGSHRDGVLVLPLSGTLTASGPAADETAGRTMQAAGKTDFGSVAPNGSASPGTTQSGPIDVAPSPSASLRRLFAHTSPDGVQLDVFQQGNAAAAPPPNQRTVLPSGVAAAGRPVLPAAAGGCLTTSQLTLEASDTAAVGTFSEPLFSGATGALVDVQIGEFGDTEGAPATWVMAQVGAGAAAVAVHFSDGVVDRAPVPSSGLVVVGHKGTAANALGVGRTASLEVLGSDGRVLAGYGLGVGNPTSMTTGPPSALPSPGRSRPANPATATAAVTKAVETGLGCETPPLQRSLVVAGGSPVEAIPSLSSGGLVTVDRVVFTSPINAVAEYHLGFSQGGRVGPLYAAASFTGKSWQLSLASVAPDLQVTPANQVGSVTIAPGGPLLIRNGPGGTAVAVYRALPGSQGEPAYGSGDVGCTPGGGVVEEVTTPGAVSVLTAPLFPGYTTPIIGAAVSSVGSAEGSPATVVGVEVGSQTTELAVTGNSGTVRGPTMGGVGVIVLPGAPTDTLGAPGSKLAVSDSSGTVLASADLQVDASAPSGPSSLPATLPTGGPGPSAPQAATQAIDDAFGAVFNCTTPPVQRVQSIQDGSLVEGALEELDTGPYEALASSVYVDIGQVVFVSPTLADVSYTLHFHSDPQLTFPMIGQAIVIDGGWRVSYSTVCAAIQLGLGSCQA